ncbi:MAG: phosphate uptake regulator PhoU [Thaumarchaeota archaeon]|nr:phosphate uptake regulator PhoU [Candidatus Terraquivivens yellowstonensis]MCL7392814.1 phosphate uptake regulator PhoU [Candidatus Terraquivivens yellowstonensis]MCL7395461.1 phosphate uptake regulator PhoU [Candidatus Terraquivivens yellowstonensis]MCL7398041.1 phosphate uptake regulator PhoU [Candidatus Terraquivivens yellowstonensis]MCL7400803.1 phosphate uptake regulator PhoU [Candidatus Terraquivivens yellowstonensis]
MIEIRKLQKVGAATLTVSLPKRWVLKKGLKPGDIVTLIENEDGSLRLDVGEAKKAENTIFTINYDLCNSNRMLSRLIIGAYLQGADIIKIISNNALTTDTVNEIQATVDRLPGLEITEQTYRMVTIQSFIDPSKFPIEVMLKRLQILVASMLNQVVSSISEGTPVNISEITRQESKVDELYFLTIRQIFLALRKWHLSMALGIDSPIYAAGVRLVAKALEDMGDIIESIAKGLNSIYKPPLKISPEIAKKLEELGMTIQTLFSKTMKALLNLDADLLNDILNNISYVLEQQDRLTDDVLLTVNGERLASSLKTVIWGFMCIVRNCEVIAEVAFNRLTRTTSNIISIEKA